MPAYTRREIDYPAIVPRLVEDRMQFVQSTRREFMALVSGAVAWPLAARAQPSLSKIPSVGVLWHAGSAEEEEVYLSVLRKAFNDLGYVEGKNIRFEHRFPAEQPDRFRSLARELVEIKPNVIIAVTALGGMELKKLTSTIPIVFVLAADPIGFGFVESLARPGGNATGLSLMTNDLSGKRLGLLREAVPSLSRVMLLVDRTDAFRERTIKANQAAAESLGISLSSAEITSPDDIEPVFAKIAEDRADGVVWGIGALLFNERARIGALALARRLPTMVSIAEEVPHGLLMSYGQDYPDFFRRAVVYVDKILKGAKPADLPVEQPTRFKLVLNLKTAKALGIVLPPTLLVAVDETIE
jgi:putative ABC transport system substrate-binding protein